jgi:hypothetical protein
MGWVVLVAGLLALVLAVRIGSRSARGATQGLAVLVVAIGSILLLRRPGSSLRLPGYGPRQWRQP